MLPRDVLEIACAEGIVPEADPGDPTAAAAWLVSEEAQRHAAVRGYVFFLKWTYETFHAISECFPRENPDGEPGKDDEARGTSAEEMLHLAQQLHLLASHGVEGAVLECGCFKGFSSACLSHVCAHLNRELIVADSFQGLPSPREDEAAWYRPGDFRGLLAEVEENVRTYGRIESVRFREGWFRDSLRGWSRPLALLWLDVDLYDSARDVLVHVLPALDSRGAIASHEFLPDRIHEGQIVHAAEPPGALRDLLGERNLPYRAAHLAGHTAVLTFPGTPGAGEAAGALLAALLPHLRDSDHRARAARDAIGLKAGLRDLARRTGARLRRGSAPS